MTEPPAEPEPISLTGADMDVHAATMQGQDWWWLYEAEAARPACPRCGARQVLSMKGAPVCEEDCPPSVDALPALAVVLALSLWSRPV
jgi:hypothetical protein